jgi:hypothetical protein
LRRNGQRNQAGVEVVMDTLNGLLTEYCRVFGYSSCSDLTMAETAFLIAVGALVIIIVATVFRRVFTGVSD